MKAFESKEEVINLINLITEIDYIDSCASYSYIKNILLNFSIPFPVLSIKKERLLFRARPHLNNEKYFNLIDEISYIPRSESNHIKDFGRANEPGQSLFYCCDMRELAFMETSNNVRYTEKNIAETFTIGAWEVQEDLRVMLITNNENINGLNSTLESLNIPFEELFNPFRKNGLDFLFLLLDFFSKEFTRDVKGETSKYKISCAFANYVNEIYGFDSFEKKTNEFDGVLYPSVLFNRAGMNLALNTKVIDKGKLKLVCAMKATMKMKNDFQFMEDDIEVCKSIDWYNKKIIWE